MGHELEMDTLMDNEIKKNALLSAIFAVLFSIIAWTLYVLLMVVAPTPFANENLRAIARVSIVLFPAIFYIIGRQDISKLDYLQLRENWLRGIIVGLLIAGIYLALNVIATMQHPVIAISANPAIWFNFIIGSPLAEEVLFRGVLFNELNRRIPSYLAVIISALMFALLHVPVWLILDGMAITLLIQNFVQIFFYGLVFATMMKFTKSLWTPLAAHWLNNLILLSLVERIMN